MPVKLKIYVIQAKRDTSVSPIDAWFNLGVGQNTSMMPQTYVDRAVTEPIVGIAGSNPYTEISIHPQASPGMSQRFTDIYKICSVRNFDLKASDQLEFTLEHIYGKAVSAAQYNAQQLLNFKRVSGQLDVIIEFQGMPTPFLVTGATANTVSYSASAATAFAKIRYTVDKYFTHSFPISGGLGLYNPQGSQYTPSFIGTAQRPLTLYTEKAPYSSYSADPAAISKYLIPLVTNNTTQYGRPLVNDPI